MALQVVAGSAIMTDMQYRNALRSRPFEQTSDTAQDCIPGIWQSTWTEHPALHIDHQ
jgi:hypothetical protein